MLKQITAGIALASLVSLPALAAPERMSIAQLDDVVAGTDTCCICPPPPPTGNEKGNNGWGNGEDPTNPGSDHGGTAPSKNANGSTGPDRRNINPTTSSGR